MKRGGITPITVRTLSLSRSLRPEDARIAAELPLPELVPEHRHRLRALQRRRTAAVARPISGGTPITSNVFMVQ